MNYPIKIRIGSAHDGDPETGEYHDATFAEAVQALQGTHEEGSYHKSTYVYVVATYEEDFTEVIDQLRGRTAERKAGQPVFAYEATVYGRDTRYGSGSLHGAQPSMGSVGAQDTEDAWLRLRVFELAIRLAEAANTYPACTECEAEVARRAERQREAEAAAAERERAHDEFHAVVGGRTGHDGLAPHVHPEGTRNHADIMCVCNHKPHRGKVCRECAKESPRGPHGTQARIRKFEEAK